MSDHSSRSGHSRPAHPSGSCRRQDSFRRPSTSCPWPAATTPSGTTRRGHHWQSGDSANHHLSGTRDVRRRARAGRAGPDLVRSTRALVLTWSAACAGGTCRARPDRHRDRRLPGPLDGPRPSPRARGDRGRSSSILALVVLVRTGRQQPARPVQPGLALRQRPRPDADRARRGARVARRLRRSSRSARSPRPDAGTEGFPRSFWLIELLLSVAILGGVRFGIRAASESGAGAGPARRGRPPADAALRRRRTGVLMARSASAQPAAGVRPVGFLDDDPPRRRRSSRAARSSAASACAGARRRRDRRPEPAHHDAERPGARGPAGRGRRHRARASRSAPCPR